MNALAKLKKIYSNHSSRLAPLRMPLMIALISTLGLYALSGSSKEIESSVEEKVPLDNLVPEGNVLVPIEVTNLEALGAVVGPYGIVDLYTTDSEGMSVTKVGTHLKIVRSPDQPSFVSVLVPEEEALSLLAAAGPFRVAVLNSQNAQTRSELHQAPRSRIQFRDKMENRP